MKIKRESKGTERYDVFAPPRDMLVGITNRCNHKCVFCAHHQMQNQQGAIDPDFLKRILCEAYEMGVRRVGLYTTGEMFMCKELETHIRNAKEIGFEYIYTDTNGALATKDNLARIITAGIDSIKFSINAGKKETYHTIHGFDDFDKVIENLKECYQLKNEINKNLKILVSFVVTKQTEKEVELLREITDPYIDVFMRFPVRTFMHQADIDLDYLKSDQEKEYQMGIPCAMVMNRIHVTYDGFLSACCIDYNNDLLLADLNKIPLKEAWLSEKAVNFRRRHRDHQLENTMCDCCVKNKYLPYMPLEI